MDVKKDYLASDTVRSYEAGSSYLAITKKASGLVLHSYGTESKLR